MGRPMKNPLLRTVKTETGCLVWTGRRDKGGYGRTGSRRPKQNLAHRKVWIHTYGDIPTGMCVLHKCDNPPCINPDHLFLGTVQDNNRDTTAKGRWAALKVTHCPMGHEYSPENTAYTKGSSGNPARNCRACKTIREKTPEYRQQKSAAQRLRRAKAKVSLLQVPCPPTRESLVAHFRKCIALAEHPETRAEFEEELRKVLAQ